MAMFSNQANFSQAVGANLHSDYQTSPVASPMFSAPIAADANVGASIAGGVAGGTTGAYSGLVLASSFGLLGGLGRATQTLDPYIMAGRGLAMGSGAASNAGFLGSGAHISRAFATGGLRAGTAALGGGLAGLAGATAVPLAIGAAVNEAGGLVYEGAQNNAFMRGAASSYFGPAYGSGQTLRPGGTFNPTQVRNMTAVLGEMASQDGILAMKDLQKLVDQFGKMGALTDVTSAAQFKERFSQLVTQTKTIAEVMGTSLEEASQLFSGLRQMGVWRSSDVMGTALTATALGAGGAQMLQQAMQTGAQGSFARGGNLSSGAFLAQRSVLDVSQAVRSGVLSDQEVINLAGAGGLQGQQRLAQRLTQSLQNMSSSSVGRLAMAGLGEIENGRFTGNIDQESLEALKTGRLSMTQLQQRGARRVTSRQGAASFTAIQEVLGQNFASRGGLQVMSSLRDEAIRRAGLDDSGEDVQQLFVQKLFGLDARDARLMEQMFRNVGKIRSDSKSRIQDVMKDRLRSLDEQRNKTFSGLGQAIGAWYERVIEEPLKNIGRDLERDIQDITNSWTDYLRGRNFGDRFSTTSRERSRLTSMVQQGLTSLTAGSESLSSSISERFDNSYFLGAFDLNALRTGQSSLETLGNLGLQVDQDRYVGFSRSRRRVHTARGDIKQGFRAATSEDTSSFIGRLQQAGMRGTSSLFDRSAMSSAGTSYREIRGSFESQMTDILSDVQFRSSIHNLSSKEKMTAMYKALQNTDAGKTLLKQVGQFTGAETEREAFTLMARESQIGAVRDPVVAELSKIPTNILVGLRTGKGRSDLMQKGVTMMSSAFGVDSDRLSEQLQNKEYGLDLAAWISNGAKSEDLKNFPTLRSAWLSGKHQDLNNIMSSIGDSKSSSGMTPNSAVRGAEFFKTAKFAGMEADMASEMVSALRADASSLSGLSGVSRKTQALVSNIAGQDIENFSDMRSVLQRLISHGKTLDSSEARRLLRSGNELGQFLGQAGSLQTIQAGSAAQVQAKLKRAGLDVGDILEGEDKLLFQQIFSDQKVDKTEAKDLRNIMERFLGSRRLGGSRGDTKAEQQGQEFAAALTRYTEESTKFVQAVAVAVPELKGVKLDNGQGLKATSDFWSLIGN